MQTAAAIENAARPVQSDTTALDYQQLGTVPMYAETHAGEDVAAFAVGVNADKGRMEQSALFEARSALFALMTNNSRI